MLIQKQYSALILLEIYMKMESNNVFIIEEAKKGHFRLFARTVKLLWISLYDLACVTIQSYCVFHNLFALIQYQYKMTLDKILNVKLSNLQLNRLKNLE